MRVERVALDRELGYRSKLDRRSAWLEELREYGKTKARWFLKERESRDTARPAAREQQPAT
jgi:hypothetical protein